MLVDYSSKPITSNISNKNLTDQQLVVLRLFVLYILSSETAFCDFSYVTPPINPKVHVLIKIR